MKSTPIVFSLVMVACSVWASAQAPSLYQQGLLALQQNRPTEALADFTGAERESPRDAAIRNFRGIALSQLGRSNEAAREYWEAIRLDPQMVDAYRNLGHLEWTEQHPEDARTALERALELSPDDPFAHFYLARVELDQHNYPDAVVHLDKSKNVWPADADFFLAAAGGYVSVHRDAEARAALARVPRSHPNILQLVQLGALQIACHQPDEGIAVFERLTAKSANAEWAQFDLALAQLEAQHPVDAEKIARSLVKSRPSAPAWMAVGIADAELHHHGEAIQAFRNAAEIDPHDEGAWLNLTRELMEELHYVDAVVAAQQGVDALPRSYALRLRLGAAYMKSARYQDAGQVFRDLIVKGDPQPTSAIGLAQALVREGKVQEAGAVLDEAQKRLGSTFLLAYFRGIMLGRAGKPGEAVESLREAVRLNPQSAVAYQWLGKEELRAMQMNQAIADLQEALKLDPDNRVARRLLAQAYAIRKQPDQAARYLREIKPGEVPKTTGDESADFLFPAWQSPSALP